MLAASKTHHAVRPAAEERRLERQVRPAVEPSLVHEVGVDAIDRPARDAELASFDLGVEGERLAGAAEPAGRGDTAADVGVEPERLEVAQIDARLQAEVGIEGADPPQRAGDLHVRVEDVGLQRLDRDVEA